jgi:hypothetical protein
VPGVLAPAGRGDPASGLGGLRLGLPEHDAAVDRHGIERDVEAVAVAVGERRTL